MPACLPIAAGLLLQLFAATGTASAPPGFLLIGHRGGVVDAAAPENSFAALEEAIRRGYTHVEVDVQSTADGFPVCLHDRSLKRAAGVDGIVDKLTLAELRARAPLELVPDFESYGARCEDRIDVMVDAKNCPDHLLPLFSERIRASLEAHGLTDGALFIGDARLRPHLRGAGLLNWRGKTRLLEVGRGAHAAGNRFFVFRHASGLNGELVRGYQQQGLKVIVSINTHHYRGGDAMELGRRDVNAMLALGVDGLQIDGEYEDAVRAFFGQRVAARE